MASPDNPEPSFDGTNKLLHILWRFNSRPDHIDKNKIIESWKSSTRFTKQLCVMSMNEILLNIEKNCTLFMDTIIDGINIMKNKFKMTFSELNHYSVIVLNILSDDIVKTGSYLNILAEDEILSYVGRLLTCALLIIHLIHGLPVNANSDPIKSAIAYLQIHRKKFEIFEDEDYPDLCFNTNNEKNIESNDGVSNFVQDQNVNEKKDRIKLLKERYEISSHLYIYSEKEIMVSTFKPSSDFNGDIKIIWIPGGSSEKCLKDGALPFPENLYNRSPEKWKITKITKDAFFPNIKIKTYQYSIVNNSDFNEVFEKDVRASMYDKNQFLRIYHKIDIFLPYAILLFISDICFYKLQCINCFSKTQIDLFELFDKKY